MKNNLCFAIALMGIMALASPREDTLHIICAKSVQMKQEAAFVTYSACIKGSAEKTWARLIEPRITRQTPKDMLKKNNFLGRIGKKKFSGVKAEKLYEYLVNAQDDKSKYFAFFETDLKD